jgi:crotonobetainyl-CoA:carnitine CoA-transferase CaiB-like acyl-CoA transferase
LEDADVFISNFLPHQLSELGLTPEIMRKEFPKIIIGNLSSYGQVGNDANRPGYDATIQARTGIMAITGETNGEPVRTGVSVLDMGAGTWLALGVLAALVKRERFGEGCIIETSLYETGVTWVSYHLSSFQISQQPSRRVGAAHPTFSPYGLFKAQDGQVCIGVGSDVVFKRLTEIIGRPDLFEDPRFNTNEGRVNNRVLLNSEIEGALVDHPVSHWVEKLGQGGVPVDALRLPEDLLNDPQAHELEMLLPNPDSDSKVKLIPGIPLRLNGVRPPIRKSAPKNTR